MLKRVLMLLALLVLVLAAIPGGMVFAAPPTIAGCQVFPDDNAWNADISDAPVHSLSGTYIANINANGSDFVHPDFGEDPSYGIPWTTVDGSQPLVPVTFDYSDDSDPGPYPIPPDAPVEGGSDRHVLVLRTSDCLLFEMWASEYQGGAEDAWTAGSGAIFDLTSNALRPDGWTSADAAGLPILPGLTRCEEVMAGEITHALRFTVGSTQRAYVYPATHYASSITDPAYPPMGLRFRLKANYNTSNLTGQALVIATALKKYGMILADNGSNWYISGDTNPDCWNDDELNQLKAVPGTAFEVVVSPNPPSLPGELLGNAGFEGADTGKQAVGWKVANATGEKRVCNAMGVENGQIVTYTEVSFEGYCAYKLTGGSTAGKIQQIVSGEGLIGGAPLILNAQVNGKNMAADAGSMFVKVIYLNGTREKYTLPFDSGTYAYTFFNTSTTALAGTGINKLKVQLRYTGAGGKMFVDAVSMSEAVNRVIPLPNAPFTDAALGSR